MDALRAAGLRVPDDISVVGFDDVPMAAWPGYDLTSVRQPVDEMADAAVEMLGLDPARRATAPTTRLIMGGLVTRGSTMPRKRAVTDDKPPARRRRA
jgi:DNA-binding LacI/PurR family transcriptional regulator